ncbi:unnamed protein product [Trypanosoma congolense IL3000]|uniref:WGS project CAEQ00000000 data, annotated contig 1070 n=1 Tax=Trypanosoma congolense (strain IL3000) TaxID=1068625 RepID=F9W3K8_TRYCI|nr:unnamed protein product [Trypanosoma congolense IL3000]
MVMMFWIVVMVVTGVSAQESGANVKDHNREVHDRLCAVLKAAVWKCVNGGEGLLEPLRNALRRTIFGNESGWNPEDLKRSLPKDYDEVLTGGGSRSAWCGGRDSGHSAPHGLLCLCKTGNNGFPLNGGTGKEKLCWQVKDALGGGAVGWGSQTSS